MTSKTVESIRKVLETHQIHRDNRHPVLKCSGCVWQGWHHDEHLANEILDVVQPIIETVERLEAIPRNPGTLSGPLIKSTCLVDPENGNYGLGTVYEGNDDGTWQDLDAGTPTRLPSSKVPLPAVLIWQPEAS